MKCASTLKSAIGAAAFGLSLLTSAGVSDAALVAYYPLDGNFNDVAGGFNGTGANSPTFVAGNNGQAVDLNGSNQFASLTTGANLGLGGTTWTVSAFVKFDTLGAANVDRAILGNEAPHATNESLHLVARGTQLHLGLFSNDQGPNGTLTTGVFTHVAWEFDNGTMRNFINGVLVGSSAGHATFSAVGAAKTVNLGKWNGTNFFDGLIDDVAIYNTALSTADVLHLAQGGSVDKLLSQSIANQPTGWISETFKRPGNATISAAGNGNGFGGSADALDAINNGTRIGLGFVNTANYFEPTGGGGTGNFGGDVEPFGLSGGADDDFVVRSTGFLQVGLNGNYQFRNNTDDGSRLRIDLNQNGVFEAGEVVILDDVLSGAHNADSAILALLKGQYMIEHIWFERGGGAEGELAVSLNSGAFQLFGNPIVGGDQAFANYGVYVTQQQITIPEPTALSLLAMGGLGLLARRRRMA